MKPNPSQVRLAVVHVVATLALFTVAAFAQPTSGTITGNVGNKATGNLLEGALVEITALQQKAMTDSTGRYVLTGVPAGRHSVVVSYEGLDPITESVQVTAGERQTRDFQLSTEIYQLAEMRISGEREGNAAAITARRNAANLKNVVALDAFGNLPNMSAGELVVRLPGVTGQLDQEGNVVAVMRG